jgi:hypothetical protein
MCMLLYLATSLDQPLQRSPELSVEEIDLARDTVRQWFSLPIVRFIGAHTGCSCGFPSIGADEPIPYFDGMFEDDEDDDRAADLRSVRSLVDLIRAHVSASGEVQLYPVWEGTEAVAPKGTITLPVDALDPATFFFNEQFLYRVIRDAE